MTFQTVDEIYESIDKTRDKLIKAVVDLNDEQSSFRASAEKWSVANVIEHLAKTEENLVRLIGKLLAQAEAGGRRSDGRMLSPVSFAEIGEKARGMKLEAPDAIKPEGIASLNDSIARLEKSRTALHALRPRIAAIDLSSTNFPHPFFGSTLR